MPDRAAGRPIEAAVLMVKPGILLAGPHLGDVTAELRERLDRFGHRLVDPRVIDAATVRERSMLRRHYHDHFEVARAGRLLPDERAALVARLDTPSFRAEHGDPATIPVVPAIELASRLGVELAVIGRWAEAAAAAYGIDTGHPLACNEVGELADVQLLPHRSDLGKLHVPRPQVEGRGACPDRGGRGVDLAEIGAVFVLNPQMASLASWWEDGPDATLVARVEPDGERAQPWADVRRRFLGTGAPSGWPAGSVRGDVLGGRSALRYRDGIEMGAARNAVHLSSGPVEALRELAVWFDVDPADTATGRALLDAGIDVGAVLDAVYVDDGTGITALAQRTAHLGIDDLVDALRGARLLAVDDV